MILAMLRNSFMQFEHFGVSTILIQEYIIACKRNVVRALGNKVKRLLACWMNEFLSGMFET